MSKSSVVFVPLHSEKPVTDYRELVREHLKIQVERDHHDTIREHKLEGCGLERGFAACPICPDCVYCGKDHR